MAAPAAQGDKGESSLQGQIETKHHPAFSCALHPASPTQSWQEPSLPEPQGTGLLEAENSVRSTGSEARGEVVSSRGSGQQGVAIGARDRGQPGTGFKQTKFTIPIPVKVGPSPWEPLQSLSPSPGPCDHDHHAGGLWTEDEVRDPGGIRHVTPQLAQGQAAGRVALIAPL